MEYENESYEFLEYQKILSWRYGWVVKGPCFFCIVTEVVSSTQMWLTTTYNSSSRDLKPLSDFHWPQTCTWYTSTHSQNSHTRKLKIK